jgi:CMP-N-acetylneuraminic acid synthetase
MKQSLLILGTARESSSRIEDKMTRKFLDTNLYKIYLKKLESLSPQYKVVMAINKNDTKIWDLTQNTSLEVIERNDKSVAKGISTRSEELHFLKDRPETHILWVNGCLPLLKVELIKQIADFYYLNDIDSLHLIKKRTNWFWGMDKLPINNTDPKCVSTQGCPHIYESIHAIQLFNKENLLTNNSYWNYTNDKDPYLYEVEDSLDFFDIDSEFEFQLAEKIYKDVTNN